MGKIIKSLVLVAIFCLISQAAILPSENIQTPPIILRSQSKNNAAPKSVDQNRLKAIFSEYSEIDTNIYGKIGIKQQDNPQPQNSQPNPVNSVQDNSKPSQNPVQNSEKTSQTSVKNEIAPAAQQKNDEPAQGDKITYPNTPQGRLAKILAETKANKKAATPLPGTNTFFSQQTNSTIPVTQITVVANQNIYDELEIVKVDVAHSEDKQAQPLEIVAYINPQQNAVLTHSIQVQDANVDQATQNSDNVGPAPAQGSDKELDKPV